MIEFSSVDLPIRTPGGTEALNLLGRLDQRAQQVVQNVGSLGRQATVASAGVRTLENATRALSYQAIGLQGPLGKIAGVLGNLSIGGPLTTALLAGIGAIGLAWSAYKSSSESAREENEKMLASLREIEGQLSKNAREQRLRSLTAERDKKLNQITNLGFDWKDALNPVETFLSLIGRGKTKEVNDLIDAVVELDKRIAALSATTSKAARDASSEDYLKGVKAIAGMDASRPSLSGLRGYQGVSGGLGQSYSGDNLLDIGDAMMKGIQEKLKQGPPPLPTELSDDMAKFLQLTELAEQVGNQFGETLANSIANGVEIAVRTGRIDDAFKAVTGGILIGLGNLMITVGTKGLLTAKWLATFQELLTKKPALAIPVALGMIAAGGAVRALGESMTDDASSGRGGGYAGGSNVGGFVDRGLVNPLNGTVGATGTISPRPQINMTAVVYGSPRDADLQRFFLNVMDLAEARRA